LRRALSVRQSVVVVPLGFGAVGPGTASLQKKLYTTVKRQ